VPGYLSAALSPAGRLLGTGWQPRLGIADCSSAKRATSSLPSTSAPVLTNRAPATESDELAVGKVAQKDRAAKHVEHVVQLRAEHGPSVHAHRCYGLRVRV
jgi:hypothetical protein